MQWWLLLVVGVWGCVVDPPMACESHVEHVEQKVVRVSVGVLADDSGQRPLVDENTVLAQMSLLKRYFGCLNLEFALQYFTINSTSLWNRQVLLSCPSVQVGDGTCQPQCNTSITNFDGGDCLPAASLTSECFEATSACREHCNLARFNWDHGRCCVDNTASLEHCRDPRSPLCRYVSPEALRRGPSSPAWTIYVARVAPCLGETRLSVPWRSTGDDVSTQGTIMDSSLLAPGNLELVHELGHILGLPDVLMETSSCSHPCASKGESAVSEPCVSAEGKDCANHSWTTDSLHNAMSEGHLFGAGCCTPATAFSTLQCSHMFCHLKRTYSSWLAKQSTSLVAELGLSGMNETEITPPVGPLSIVGAAIGIAILIGAGVGVHHAMRSEPISLPSDPKPAPIDSGENYQPM